MDVVSGVTKAALDAEAGGADRQDVHVEIRVMIFVDVGVQHGDVDHRGGHVLPVKLSSLHGVHEVVTQARRLPVVDGGLPTADGAVLDVSGLL